MADTSKRRTPKRSPPIGPLDKEFRIAARAVPVSRMMLSVNPADDLNRVLDRYEKLLKAGHAELVKGLTEKALETMELQMNELDDPWDEVTMAVHRIQYLHQRACRKLRADPETLARWLFDWKRRSRFNFFYDAPREYAETLGTTGLALFASLEAKEKFEERKRLK
jgi:hypothetical protein